MRARAINTVAGGAIALIAYAVWPTWERHQVSEAMARMLDQFREYFRGFMRAMRGTNRSRHRSIALAWLPGWLERIWKRPSNGRWASQEAQRRASRC